VPRLLTVLFGLVLFYVVRDVYSVNRPLAFTPARLDAQSYLAMQWLKENDSGLFYIDPFSAKAKYVFVAPNQPKPAGGERLNNFGGVELWRVPDVLPAAFTAPPGLLKSGTAIKNTDVTPLQAYLDGPNRVVVEGTINIALCTSFVR
jgi:hypothetical protein